VSVPDDKRRKNSRISSHIYRVVFFAFSRKSTAIILSMSRFASMFHSRLSRMR